MARRSKLTKELIDDFSKAISIGLNIKASCDYAGISEPSYYAYMKKAEEDFDNNVESLNTEFFNAVKKAEASFRVYHMSKIRDAAEGGSWQASAWSLERRFPNEFGKHVSVEADNGILNDLLTAIKADEENERT